MLAIVSKLIVAGFISSAEVRLRLGDRRQAALLVVFDDIVAQHGPRPFLHNNATAVVTDAIADDDGRGGAADVDAVTRLIKNILLNPGPRVAKNGDAIGPIALKDILLNQRSAGSIHRDAIVEIVRKRVVNEDGTARLDPDAIAPMIGIGDGDARERSLVSSQNRDALTSCCRTDKIAPTPNKYPLTPTTRIPLDGDAWLEPNGKLLARFSAVGARGQQNGRSWLGYGESLGKRAERRSLATISRPVIANGGIHEE